MNMVHPPLLKHYLTRPRISFAHLMAGVMLIFLVSVSFIVFSLQKEQQDINSRINSNLPFITPYRKWEITSVAPAETAQVLNITLQSNIGNVRNYQNVYSYGLSVNGQYLALNSIEGISVVDLEKDLSKSIDVPATKFRTNLGESFSWSSDNTYFTSTTLIEGESATRVWVFNRSGDFVKDIDIKVPFKSNGDPRIENSLFSFSENLIMVRSYKSDDLEFQKDDGSEYNLYQIPSYLTVLNLQGEILKDINISDYSDSDVNIAYRWDKNNYSLINYLTYGDTVPDFNRDYLYNKVSIQD